MEAERLEPSRRTAAPRAPRGARTARIDRETTETRIALCLTLDGRGRYSVRTGIRFLDHMLELFARHGAFDLTVEATGDLDVDQHHTVEDIGIVLGEAVAAALGSKRGINRAGYFVMPMDETLGVAAVDLSGRVHAVTDLKLRARRVGDLQAELIAHVGQVLGRFACPKQLRFTDALPKTRSGKIMRRLLRDIAAGREVVGDTTTLEDLTVLAALRGDEE